MTPAPENFDKRLQGLTAGHRRLSAHGAGYSAYVRYTRIILPFVALVLVGIVIARLHDDPLKEQIAQLPPDEKTAPGATELAKPRYEGTDAQNQPYRVTADKAVRASDSSSVVLLEKPQGDITLNSGSWISLQADSGSYDTSLGTLALKTNVALYQDGGYELHTDTLDVRMQDHIASTTSPVTGQGPMGSLTAQNMTMNDSGNEIIFGGPAHMTLRLKGVAGK